MLDISPIGCMLDRLAWSAQPDERILIQLEGLGFQPARISWIEDQRIGIEFEQLLHEAVLSRLKLARQRRVRPRTDYRQRSKWQLAGFD